MDRLGEQPKFEVRPVIEQKPFKNPAAQSFFGEWCRINDSIQPQIISRDEWEKRGIKGILEKRPDGKPTLFIPEDLQLWEMVGVMEVVDHDTFAANPERRVEAKEKLLALAKTFQNAGTYIAQRIEGIHEGREMAEALAQEFYEYGQSLIEGKRPDTPLGIDNIASQNITPEETETVDRFLARDTLYESRQKRVEKGIAEDPSKKDELYENERQKALSQFFRVAEKAFALESKSTDGELQKRATQLKPWQSDASIHSAFLARIEKAITQKVETPKREFEMAIFRRGLKKLAGEMKERGWRHTVNSFFENLGLDLRVEQKKLVDVLHIPKLKAELEATRQTGDHAKISKKEREIADKILNAVSSFPYKSDAYSPAKMVANQYINCVGATTLGGALMKEVGLNYLVGGVPKHSITILITADGKIFWYDMLGSLFNRKEIRDRDLRGTINGNNKVTVKDIVDFSQNPGANPRGMQMQFSPLWYRFNTGEIWRKLPNPYFNVFHPEHGQKMQILNSIGIALSSLGRYEEAVEAYRQAIDIDPKFTYPYNGLGNTLFSLGRYEEAIEKYRQAIAIDPRYDSPYYGLGRTFRHLGRYEEAIEAYQRLINLADKNEDSYWIKLAKQTIAELRK